MRTYSSNAQLQSALRSFRQKGQSIAFVPTMGNLHEGHLDLVRKARQLCDVVVVSIFVNPLQFGPNEDLDAYPRTMAADKEKLFSEGVQVLYAPAWRKFIPRAWQAQTLVHVPDLGETLCGSSRPGHFDGVTTVVSKLFNIVQPDVAVFGEKDFQQLSIVRKMVNDLCMPIEIVGVATTRDEDGLAKSSRNGYLSLRATTYRPVLHQTLNSCREAIACGFDNFLQLESHARMKLLQAGFDPTTSPFATPAPCVQSPKTPRRLPSWPPPGWAHAPDRQCTTGAQPRIRLGHAGRRPLSRPPTDSVNFRSLVACTTEPAKYYPVFTSSTKGKANMSEFPIRPVPANFRDAHINAEKYQAMYQRSIEDPEGFWAKWPTHFLSWDKPGTRRQLRFRQGRSAVVRRRQTQCQLQLH